MREFRNLDIWNSSISFATKIYEIAPILRVNDKFGIASQMTRAAVSIPSNIAEGCRGSNKELVRFLNIALGSSFELETQLIIAGNVIDDLPNKTVSTLLDELTVIQKKINAYRSYIKKQPPQNPKIPKP